MLKSLSNDLTAMRTAESILMESIHMKIGDTLLSLFD